MRQGSFSELADTKSQFTLSNGINVKGFFAKDQVCVTQYIEDTCSAGFTFFMITEQSGITSQASAIVGLAPQTMGLTSLVDSLK